MARMSLDDIRGDMAASEASDVARVEAVTEADIARWNAEDGFDPNDTLVGLRRVYSPAEIRNRAGLTQAEIAARLRVPVKTWRNWEQGRTSLDPAVRSLLDIVADDPARAFGALGTGPRPAAAVDQVEVAAMVASTARIVADIRHEVIVQVLDKPKPGKRMRLMWHGFRPYPVKAKSYLPPRFRAAQRSKRKQVGDAVGD